MKQKVRFLILFLLSPPVWAASEGIPVSFILFQTLNFGNFLAILIYFIIKKVPPLLKRKHQNFLEMSQRSEKLFNQAQEENKQIKQKLKNIENQMTQVNSVIQKGVQSMEKQILEETQAICSTIYSTAQSLLDREHIKLKQSLLKEILDQIKISCKDQDTNSIQFLNKIQKRKA